MPSRYPASLYGGTPPHSDKGTSLAAAESMAVPSGSIRVRILAAIKESGTLGMTDDEIEVAFNLRHQTASARRRELVLLGCIRPLGLRKTSSGRNANVWIFVKDEAPTIRGTKAEE